MSREVTTMQVQSRFGTTSRLGIGVATVMRVPSTTKQLELLRSAYRLGYTHFDVAPLYGLGRAEGVLGRFLKDAPHSTVATKFGLRPSTVQRIGAIAQRPVRVAARKSGLLRTLSRRLAGQPSSIESPTVEDLKASLELSAHRLGRGELDAVLTHEVNWTPQWSDMWTDLQALSLPARSLGLAASHGQLEKYPRKVVENADVIQTRAYPFHKTGADCTQIIYGVTALARAYETQASDAASKHSARVIQHATDITATAAYASQLIYSASIVQPNSIVVVGSTSAVHLEHLWRGVEFLFSRQDPGIDEAAQFLRSHATME